MFFNIVLSLHLFLCVLLVVLVLLQQGKGADAGAALGGGSNTLFGAGGATSLMVRVTTGTAVLFMITSIFLVRGYGERSEVGTSGVSVSAPEGFDSEAPAAAPAAAPQAEAPAPAAVPNDAAPVDGAPKAP